MEASLSRSLGSEARQGWEGICRTGTACLSPDRSLVSVGCGPCRSGPPRGSGKPGKFSFRAGLSLLADAESGPGRLAFRLLTYLFAT